MRPPWRDLLLIPMAAPETPSLRMMRRTWQALCLSLALVMLGFPGLHRLAGTGATLLAALLIAAAVATGGAYWRAKLRADADHLDAIGRERR